MDNAIYCLIRENQPQSFNKYHCSLHPFYSKTHSVTLISLSF
ncbi:hypothetical protein [Leptospira noguchii]|nr:hypothetical protein [Leptospira noguchii]